MIKNIPHRHFVFSIPKIIRIYFLFDRSLLKELARIAWEVLGLYYKNAVNKDKRDRPPPRVLAVADTFDDWRCDDHINNDYTDF